MPIVVRTTAFDGFEALQNVVQDNRSEVVQLGRGRMSGVLTHLSLGTFGTSGTFGISTGHFSRGMRASGVMSEQRWTLGMMLGSDGPAIGHGGELSPGDPVLAAPGYERHIAFQDSTRYFAAMIAPEELRTFLAPDAGAFDRLSRYRVSVLSTDPAIAAENLRQLQPVLNALIEQGAAMTDKIAEFYTRNIMELLTLPFRSASGYRGVELHQRSQALVQEIDRFLMMAGMRPVHISELCERFDVSRRSLYRAFDDVLGMGPITFLRQKRLGDVHSVLLQGGPVHIREVAIAHGFLQQGKFAIEYRRLFGELPSDTLRRARQALMLLLGVGMAALMAD